MLAFAALTIVSAHVVLPDIGGNKVTVFPSDVKRGVVTLFVLSDCPIANQFAPEIRRIAMEYGAKGWKFFLIYVEDDAPETLRRLRKHAASYGYNFAALVDARRTLVHHAGATISPEAAVFSPDGTLRYRGRIDDRFPALGIRRRAPRTHDLRAALDAIASGRQIVTPRTKAIGCALPPSEP